MAASFLLPLSLVLVLGCAHLSVENRGSTTNVGEAKEEIAHTFVPGPPDHCYAQVQMIDPSTRCTESAQGVLALRGEQSVDGWCRLDCQQQGAHWVLQVERAGFRGEATCRVGDLASSVAFVSIPVPHTENVKLVWLDEREWAESILVRIDLETGETLEWRRASSQSCGSPW